MNEIEQLCEAHYRFMSLWPGSVREDWAGAAWIGNRLLPVPFRNHIALVRSQPQEVVALIERASSFYEQWGAQPAFQLDAATTPVDLPETLKSSGYIKQTEEVWMLCEVAERPTVPSPTHVVVAMLTPDSPETWIQAYIDCYNTNFRTPVHTHAGFGTSFRGVLPHPSGIHCLALVDGQPAGAVSLIHEAGLGGVYNVGTFPAFRGQGVATALLLNLLTIARQAEITQLLLQTLHHGPAQPIYERVGFHTRFVRDWYLLKAPGGIWS
jgi:GNAT superfamily N-acetyltransferase